MAALALALPVTLAAAAADLATCRAIADDGARLACYDRLAGTATTPAIAAPVQPAAPPPAPTGAAASGAPTATDLFGRDSDTAAAQLGAAAGIAPLRELQASLTAVSRAADGRLRLTLDNGQAWSQVDTRRATLEPGDAVVIRRGAFGSFLLSAGRGEAALRVRRDR